MGGAAYLHTLIASVPTAANAQYYAEIVKEHAIMRRLVEAGTKIAQLGYASEAEVDALVDQAQAEIYAVTDGNAKEDYVYLLRGLGSHDERDRRELEPPRWRVRRAH